MVDEYGAKAASKRKMKRRSDKDACLNNLRLNLNLAYTSHRDQSHQSLDGAKGFEHPHLGRRRDKLLRGSLDDVSSNPLGEFLSEESSLRRSRSLAIAREDVFTSLEIPTQRRRSQLIPRAKLIDRTSFKDRCLKHVRSQESLRINECILLKRKTSITSEVVVSKCTTVNSTGKSQSTVTQKRKSRAKGSPFIHANNIRTEIRSEIDSPDSDCQNKTGIQDSLTYSDIGLGLPNYYPDSKCDTDASLTDNVSVLDDKIVEHPSHGKLTSLDNLCKQLEKAKDNSQQNDSIPYDENIVLSKNTPLYDSIGHYPYEIKPFYKPKTIRGGTPYLRKNDSYCSEEPQSLPFYVASGVATYDSDSTLSDCNFAYYKSGKSKPNEVDKFEFAESDTNFDEIKLSNENIKLIHRDKVTENVLYDSKSESSNVEVNPIYEDKAHLENDTAEESYLHISESKPIKSYCSLPQDINIITLREEPKQERVKTSTIVQAVDDANVNSVVGEEYKTIINVEADNSPFTKQQSPSQESKRHSHNYLREFLESQKGSKKPLQNFLAKKISRAFGDRNSKSTNLKENQYSSLPDITISKNLRKCDKIDRKLRKCENQKVPKPQNDTTTNRFIVNIGRHFDVTAQSNVPVDFEVKISKIPKQQKAKQKPSKNDSSNNNKRDEDEEKNLLEAIRNLKETLSGKEERNLDKPEIVAVHKKIDLNKNTDNFKEAKSQNSKMERKNSIDKEYQEKVETMRSYWDKIANDAAEKATTDAKSRENENKEDTKENNKGGTYRCKIVEVQTKVDEVKKLFEENSAGKWPGKVQMAKQVFETKSKNEVDGTSSNAYVKECKEMFENPYFERETSNQFESLNPIVMEIIEQDGMKNTENEERNNADNLKKHKPVGKAKSISIEPEFDHVRYRIMKSDVFQKKIFANCDKESQFDGLMQYLQDYSFQELLIDNNIVIIEPIRSNVKYEPHKSKMTRNVTQLLHKTNNSTNNSGKSLRRHFFYHPIRVNREVNDDELPNPDTVKQVRQFFEGGLKRTQSSKNLEEIAKQSIQYNNVDPDKDRCSATDTNSSTMSDYGSNENLFESLEELCCDNQYVSEDILARIREQGTSITYYGGRVLNKYNGKSSSLTKAIMDEIRKNSSKSNDCQCRKNPDNKHHKSVTFADTNGHVSDNKDSYQGIKFKLLKSNSCSSRLELVGTKDLSEYRNKYLNKQKQLLDEQNKKKQEENEAPTEKSYTEITTINLKNFKAINDLSKDETNRHVILQIDKNTVNESIKRQDERSPKIIGEEIKTPTIKMPQWSEMSGERNCLGTNKSAKINYNDYHNVDKINRKTKKDHEMEFEPYEIAGN